MKSETHTRPLRDLVDGFTNGAIMLPQFQRDYVWSSEKIRNLLDSLLKGFPIGGFYLWFPHAGSCLDPKPQRGRGAVVPATRPFEGYLIDGQQRLTSLEAAFGLFSGEDKGAAELRCYLDLAAPDEDRGRCSKIFVTSGGNKAVAQRANWDSTLIDLHQISRPLDSAALNWREEIGKKLSERGWDTQKVSTALRRFYNACKMLNQLVPCTTISEVENKEAIEVFSRLNKGGSPLKQGDVRAAELALQGEPVKVLKSMRAFVGGELPQRLGFGFSFAVRALVLFHRQSAQFSALKPDWMKEHGRPIDKSWDVTKPAIKKALEFVDGMGWSRRALLPSVNAVIVLAAGIDRDQGRVVDPQLYRRWLCLTALRTVFQGSVETIMNRFYRAIQKSEKGAAKALLGALEKNKKARVDASEFNRYARPWGPPTQVMHAWLVGKKAEDWLNREPVDRLSRAMNSSSAGSDLSVHHIFPRQIMKDHIDAVNCPANYALLSRKTNAEFGPKPPDEVLAMLTADQRKRAAVQFFYGNELETGQYEEFCQWRAEQLAESINDWLGIR